MFKNLAIKWKLATLVAILLLAMASMGVTGYLSTHQVGKAMNEVGQVRMPSVQGLLVLNQAQTAIKAATVSTAMFENEYKAQGQFANIRDQRKKAWADAEAGWKKYASLPQSAQEAALAKEFTAAWEAWKKADNDMGATIASLAQNKDEQIQKELFVQFYSQNAATSQLFDAAQEILEKIVALNEKLAAESVKEGSATISRSGQIMLVAAILALLISLPCAALITTSVTKPIAEAVMLAKTVAAGDLTSEIKVDTNEETGQLLSALKDMNDNLVRIVGEVRNGTETIATASGEIASGSLDLSARTEQQAGSLEETASSMEELTGTVKQNADNARQAHSLAITASDVAGKGGMVVSQVVDTMSGINESSKKIADIIGVIDGIAFQTNILALNAAVEAARAGEQGRGFAVVASEVRNLAQRSAAAAKEIKTLIVDSVEKVNAGGKLVDQAGATMNEIVTSVQRVTDIMAEILAASQEQSSGIEQVNQAITQMDTMTQQNAALVEESAAAAQSMQEQAAKLAQIVGVFKTSAAYQTASISALPKAAPAGAPTSLIPKQERAAVVPPLPQRQRLAVTNGDDWEEF